MTIKQFEADFSVMANHVSNDSKGRIELYWDWLDGDNVVIGARRATDPDEIQDTGFDGQPYTVKAWKDDSVNCYCDVIRSLAIELQNALTDEDGREWCGAHAFDMDSWDCDGDTEFDEDVEINGKTYNACQSVTMQIYV